jgi:predicted dehydrogenase
VSAAATAELRWGIAGAGRVARAFGQDIARTPGNRVEAVAARDPARAQSLRRDLGGRRTLPGYQALFDDPDIDVIYLATVSSVHADQAIRALAAGRNVVVEKPLGVSAAEARDVAAAARQSGTFCLEAMWMRMHPLVRQAQQLARDGTIGDVLSVRAELSTPHPYQPWDRLFDPALGGGAALDLGLYTAHFAWLFLGAPAGMTTVLTRAPNGVDDGITMQWRYPAGQVAELIANFKRPSTLGGLVSGTRGSLHLGPRLNRPRCLSVRAGQSEPVTQTADSPGNGYTYEIAEVARCLRLGLTESPLAPLEDSLGVLAAMDQARA